MRNGTRKTAFALVVHLGLRVAVGALNPKPLMFTLGLAAATSPAQANTSSSSTSTSVVMTPQLVHQLDYHSNLTVSPDGRLVATLHRGSIYVWDVDSGAILHTLSPPGAPRFAFTNDSQSLRYLTVSIANGKGTLLSGEWNLVTGETSQKVGPSGIFVSALIPGGKRAILGENPTGTVHVYDIENNKIVRSFGTPPPAGTPLNQIDPRTISIISVSTNGNVVLLTRVSGAVELWDAETGKRRYELKQKSMSNWIGISSNGSRAAYTRASETMGTALVDIVDVAAGKLVRTISVPDDLAGGLAISPDGRRLMTIATKGAFHLWNVDTGSAAYSGTMGASQGMSTLSFVGNDQVVWGSMHRLELWNPTQNKKVQSFATDKSQVNSISSAAMTPQLDRAFAVASESTTDRLISWDLASFGRRAVFPQPRSGLKIAANGSRAWAPSSSGYTVLDLQTLQQRNITRDTGTTLTGNFIVSGNGQKLFVGGQRRGSDPITNQTWPEIVLSEWDAESGAKIEKIVRQKPNMSRTLLATSHDGRLVATNDYDILSKRTEVHLWDLQRDALVYTSDMTHSSHVAAALSGNGQSLALAFMEKSKPGSHTVQIIDVPTGKVRTSMTSNVLGLVQAMTFSPNADKLALGCVTVEVFHSLTGTLAHTFRGDPQWITSLAFSPDGKYLLTAGQAGTMNMYRLDKPASVTMIASGDEWLVYDENGYFDASRRGGALVAAVDGLRAYRIDQLAVRNNRPDLLLERMGLGDPHTIAHFRSRYQRRLEKLGIANESALPSFRSTPEVTITNVDVVAAVATVKFDVVARGADLLRYNVFVNDVPLFGALGKTTSGKTQHFEERIELGSGRNKIEVSALDARGGESLRAVRVVERKEAVPGNLYYLAFGVSKYKNPKYNLGYPHKDVMDLGDVLRAASGKTFGQVHMRTYVNEQATVDNIRQAKEFLNDATVDDTVVLFIAGHGLHAPDANADYYFATHEVDPKRLSETAARFEVVEDLLTGIRPRKKLFLMDTCESGEREKDDAPSGGIPTAARSLVARSARQLELDVSRAHAPLDTATHKRKYYDRERYIYNDLTRRTGAIVISSSRGAEFSYELEEIANGVFTEEILLALTSDRADRDRDGMVSTDELRTHLGQAVPKRTDDQQHPTVDRDNLDARFGFPVVVDAAGIVDRVVLPARENDSANKPTVPPEKSPSIVARPHGCGCDVANATGGQASALLAGFAAIAAWLRRAKRR